MFSLTIPTEPRWLDLPMGVRVKVRPLDGLVAGAAKRHAKRELMRMRQEMEERIAAGVPTDGLPDLDDPNVAESLAEMEYARALAKYGVMEFDGVGDLSGEKAIPFSSEMAQALVVHPDIMDDFIRSYMAPVISQVAEGNASATTLNGSTGAVANTATDASEPAPDAQEQLAVH